ncbi:MAG: hypothetical protein HXK63_01565 [Campylobacter sp.]|nr:hypothetical protein [Campylobacter sp.]
MHGALLRASAVQTRLPPLRSRAVRVWLRDMALRIGAAQSKFNHTSLQVTHKILSRGRGAKNFMAPILRRNFGAVSQQIRSGV